MASSSTSDLSTTSFSKPLPPLISLVRHPQTLANQALLLQGSTDSDLSPLGQSQLEALCSKWAELHKDQVTLIVSSPLGRTKKLAEGLLQATSSSSTSIIIFRDGLKERDFGGLESSRKGKHVLGFPKGKGNGETKDRFGKRVKAEGQFWLEVACGKNSVEDLFIEGTPLVKEDQQDIDIVGKGKRRLEEDDQSNSNTNSPLKKQLTDSLAISRKDLTDKPMGNSTAMAFSPEKGTVDTTSISPTPRTHILIVTHGLWLSTFFYLNNLKLPFASNTGVYTLSVHSEVPRNSFSASPKETISLKVLKANNVQHLVGIVGGNGTKKSKGKFAAAGSDPKQKKLDGFFKPKSS